MVATNLRHCMIEDLNLRPIIIIIFPPKKGLDARSGICSKPAFNFYTCNQEFDCKMEMLQVFLSLMICFLGYIFQFVILSNNHNYNYISC